MAEQRRRRHREIGDFLFGIWAFFCLFIAPLIAVMGYLFDR